MLGVCGGPAHSHHLHAGGAQLTPVASQHAVPSSRLDSQARDLEPSEGTPLPRSAHAVRGPGLKNITWCLAQGFTNLAPSSDHVEALDKPRGLQQEEQQVSSHCPSKLPLGCLRGGGASEGCPHSTCKGDVGGQCTDAWSEGGGHRKSSSLQSSPFCTCSPPPPTPLGLLPRADTRLPGGHR